MSRIAELRRRLGAELERRLVPAVPTRRLRFARVLAELERLPPSGVRVLDVGCGDGLLAHAVARRHPDWFVLGIDLNDGLLERARRRAVELGLANAEFRRADATSDLGSETFDVVSLLECLAEIAGDERAISVAVRALRPGGVLLAQVPAHDWRPVLPFGAPTWRDEIRHGYRRDELASLFASNGLAGVELQPTDHALVRAAQEIVDAARARGTALRTFAHPLGIIAVRLELLGVAVGEPRSIFVTAQRPGALPECRGATSSTSSADGQ